LSARGGGGTIRPRAGQPALPAGLNMTGATDEHGWLTITRPTDWGLVSLLVRCKSSSASAAAHPSWLQATLQSSSDPEIEAGLASVMLRPSVPQQGLCGPRVQLQPQLQLKQHHCGVTVLRRWVPLVLARLRSQQGCRCLASPHQWRHCCSWIRRGAEAPHRQNRCQEPAEQVYAASGGWQ